jgi:hypothetical protein
LVLVDLDAPGLVKGNPTLWAETAIMITFDEGA